MEMNRVVLIVTLILFGMLNVVAQEGSLKFLNYNALHGFNDDDDLKEMYVKWVKKIDPDIIAYQEMNGYNQNKLGNLAESYGHPYAVIMNEEFGLPVTHPIAITSKYPILDVRRVIDNMWHGYVYANIEGVHLFVTHLAPFTLNDRRKDIKKIVAQANLLPQNEKILIAGDFNAVSPVDSTEYGEILLTSMKRIEGRLEPKSNTPIVRDRTIYRNNLNNGKIDYSVIQQVIDAGYKDAFYLKNKEFKNSVPTKGYWKPSSKPRRIDYIWLNEPLSDYLVTADILQDEVTANLSDHYPMLVEFNLPDK